MKKTLTSKFANLTTQDLIRWFVYGIIILVTLVYSTQFNSAFTIPKLTVLRILTLLIIVVWGIQVLTQKKLILRSSPLNKWVVGYGFVLCLVTLFSTYFWVSFWGDQSRFIGLPTMLNLLFLSVVALNFFTTREQIKTYTKISVWVAIVAAIYGILQGQGLVSTQNWDYDPMFRVFGTMGHSNHFGAYLAFNFMLLIGLLLNSRNLLGKTIYTAGGVAMFIAILETASRGAFFAFVGALMVFIVAWIYYQRQQIINHKKKIISIFIGLMMLLGVFHSPILNKINNLSLTQRTISTIEFLADGNIPDRVSWWFSSLAMFRDQPILGHGLSTFRDVYNLYRRTDYRVPYDVQDTVTPESVHMEYFDILATEGLLGLSVYLGLILCWAKYLFKILKNKDIPRRRKTTTLSFLAAGLVYFIQVLMSFGVVSTLVPLYILLGISMVYYHIVADPKPQSEQFKIHKIKDGGIFTGVGLLLFLVFFGGLFTFRQASTEWHLQKAQELRGQGEVNAMIEEYEKATKAIDTIYAYWEDFGMSTFDFSTGTKDIEIVKYLLNKSINAYENAYALVQTQPYLQANLGLYYTVYAEVLKTEGAIAEAQKARDIGEGFYKEAVTLGVNNPLYAYNYGLLLMGLGRDSEAKDSFLYILTFRDPYKDVYTRLAQIEVNAKNYEDARYYVQKAFEVDPGDQAAKQVLERINAETN